MKLRLEIKFGNEAMESYQDAALAIAATLNMKQETYPEDGDELTIVDLNGNKVGKWWVSE